MPTKELKDYDSTLIASAQALTNTWADLGPDVLNIGGTHAVNLWLDVVANNSTSVQFRVVGLLTPGSANNYDFPIETVTATTVTVDPEEKALADGNQKSILTFSLGGGVPFAKIQVKAGVVGATPGVVTTAYLTKGKS